MTAKTTIAVFVGRRVRFTFRTTGEEHAGVVERVDGPFVYVRADGGWTYVTTARYLRAA